MSMYFGVGGLNFSPRVNCFVFSRRLSQQREKKANRVSFFMEEL